MSSSGSVVPLTTSDVSVECSGSVDGPAGCGVTWGCVLLKGSSAAVVAAESPSPGRPLVVASSVAVASVDGTPQHNPHVYIYLSVMYIL